MPAILGISMNIWRDYIEIDYNIYGVCRIRQRGFVERIMLRLSHIIVLAIFIIR